MALATCIQEGTELAFALFLLNTLYRGLFSLVAKEIDHNCGGPFWLFQAWLYAYFPKIRPTTQTPYFSPCESYAKFFLSFRPASTNSFTKVVTILFKLPVDRDPQLFIHFHSFHFSSSGMTHINVEPQTLSDTWRQKKKDF